jgi:uncharacterized membrane protein YfcA
LRWQLVLTGSFVILGLAGFFMVRMFLPDSSFPSVHSFLQILLTKEFLFYLTAGFIAQLIDGALGMAYGVTSTSLLLSAGISPAVASASVHVAEVFTTAASGASHWRFGNIQKNLFVKLVLPGALGAALGAYVLTSFDGDMIKPYVAAYLLLMGVIILLKTMDKSISLRGLKHVRTLALVGGFVDASGGGGWGPVVTSTLIASGHKVGAAIGTINAVEFFIAFTASGVFGFFVGLAGWQVVLGLILGGVLAAPIGAYACHKINPKLCMLFVGVLIIFLSVQTLIRSL